jgi:hypothetical protein
VTDSTCDPPPSGGEPPSAASEREETQFSLTELLLVVTFGAIGLAGAQWLPPGWFAGGAGILALVTILLLTIAAPESRALRLAWWSLTALYVLAALASVVLTLRGS